MTLRPSWRMRRAWAFGRRSGPAISSDLLKQRLSEEAAAIDRRVRATIRDDTRRRRIAFPDFHPMPDWTEVRARFSLGDAGQPRVEIGLGTMLAIDDLVLFAATMDSFLIPSREAIRTAPPGRTYRLAEPMRTEGAYLAYSGRFFDYTQALQGRHLDPDQLSFAMPVEDWRLDQAGLVAELAIAWVLLHEYSHWALAHARLLEAASGDIGFSEAPDAPLPSFALGRGRPSGIRDHRLSQILEVHADTAAFHLLVSYAQRETGPIGTFNRRVNRTSGETDPQRLAGIDAPQGVRLCLTAAAIACIVLDGYDGGRRQTKSSHPSPAARFMNLQSQAPVAVPGLLREVDGALVVQDDAEAAFTVVKLGEMMGLAVNDAQLVAGISALARDRSGKGSAWDPRNWHRAAWREDMRRQWHTGVEEGPETTVAGRELAGLPLDDPALNSLLRRIQFETFGSLFDIYV